MRRGQLAQQMCTVREGLAYRATSIHRPDSFVRGALPGRGPRGGSSTGAYEWNKCARMYDLAAFTTHKREEVSVEELRAMQYTQPR